MCTEPFIPPELIRNVPYITMTGCENVHIEHHHGMISYRPEEIVFGTGCGMLTVAGHGLFVRRYTADEALVSGSIDSVLFGDCAGESR